MNRIAVSILLLGAVLPLLAVGQASSSPQTLDERVRQFLDAQKDQWREENITAADGRFLYDLIVGKGYTRVLEIGTSTGHSGIWVVDDHPMVRERLNALLRSWSSYFSYGTRLLAYRTVDNYVYERVLHFLRRRHKVPTHGTRRFPADTVFGELGVLRLRRVHLGPPPCAMR